MNSCI